MACAELAPFVCGGSFSALTAGDAVAALGKTLSRLEHRVTVVLPHYPELADNSGIMLARRLTRLKLEVGGETLEAPILNARLGSDVELIAIDLPGVLDQEGILGTAQDAERFGLFARAVCQLVDKRADEGTPFDVVHAHDWPAALIPFLLKKGGRGPRCVLTVHDAAEQGRFPKDKVDAIGLSWDDFHPDGLEFYGDLNMLKAGVISADVVTTVSPHYAKELAEAGGGDGLEGVFEARPGGVVGVLNGIDYARWSPATDPHVRSRYDSEDASNKGRCKAALVKELDLPIEPDRPLLAFFGPIDERHGADLVLGALEGIAKTGARLVIAGGGDEALIGAIEDAVASMDNDVVYVGEASEPMTHRLVSAADAVLVPSRKEPCGLFQQIAQRYGAPPIARAAGGLVDTVVDCDARCESGTGFLFDEPSPEALLSAVQRAVAAMKTPSWGGLRRRVMRLDVSWERPARRYARLYQPS